MPLVPVEWSVVVIGGWNPSHITPNGVTEHLFQIPQGTPIQVVVSMDQILPVRLIHDGLIVTASMLSLQINLEACTDAKLDEARVLARRAIERWADTPVKVAGYNFIYRSQGDVGDFERLTAALESSADASFDRIGQQTNLRELDRKFVWNGGINTIYLIHDRAEGRFSLQFNFEKAGTRDELLAWLSRPIAEARQQVDTLMFECFGLPREVVQL